MQIRSRVVLWYSLATVMMVPPSAGLARRRRACDSIHLQSCLLLSWASALFGNGPVHRAPDLLTRLDDEWRKIRVFLLCRRRHDWLPKPCALHATAAAAHRVCGVCDVLWQPRCDAQPRRSREERGTVRKPVMTAFAQKKHSDFAPFVIEASGGLVRGVRVHCRRGH